MNTGTPETFLAANPDGLRLLLNHLPQGLLILDQDRICFTSQTLLTLVGLTDAETLLHQHWEQLIDDESRQAMKNALSALRSKVRNNNPIELILQSSSEKRLYCEATFALAAVADTELTLISLRDITAQKHQEQQ
ncbi:MAG: PAS domain-containing protein, partial [Gammaproteobacteria bacterium]|nr:PAS domain-containing protein [Gammaproteobacteria bacterium]